MWSTGCLKTTTWRRVTLVQSVTSACPWAEWTQRLFGCITTRPTSSRTVATGATTTTWGGWTWATRRTARFGRGCRQTWMTPWGGQMVSALFDWSLSIMWSSLWGNMNITAAQWKQSIWVFRSCDFRSMTLQLMENLTSSLWFEINHFFLSHFVLKAASIWFLLF